MKIVAIIGSPKGRGAGCSIVEKIEAGMRTMGAVEFDYVFLKDVNLKFCMGCYSCMAKGEDTCPLKDDRAEIQQNLVAADGIILSSPVYVSNVSALMKNFIDRFAYINHRPQFHRQKVLNVVNMAGNDKKATLSALRIAVGGARGVRIIHELAIATPPWPQTEGVVAAKERSIDTAARNFYRSCLDTSLPFPTLKGYMDFLIMQKLYLNLRPYFPADYEFYSDRSYYFPTKINPIKVIEAKIVVGIMMGLWKKMSLGPGAVS